MSDTRRDLQTETKAVTFYSIHTEDFREHRTLQFDTEAGIIPADLTGVVWKLNVSTNRGADAALFTQGTAPTIAVSGIVDEDAAAGKYAINVIAEDVATIWAHREPESEEFRLWLEVLATFPPGYAQFPSRSVVVVQGDWIIQQSAVK